MARARKSRPLTPVKVALQSTFSRLGLSQQLAQQRALAVWAEVVGPQIAAATQPIGVRDGVLFVATRSSAWAHELIYRKAGILERLRNELGPNTVSDIRFLPRGYRMGVPVANADAPDVTEWGEVALQPRDWEVVAQILEPIEDPQLRQRLEQVVVHSQQIRRWQEAHGWKTCRRCGLPHMEAGSLCGNCRFPGESR